MKCIRPRGRVFAAVLAATVTALLATAAPAYAGTFKVTSN